MGHFKCSLYYADFRKKKKSRVRQRADVFPETLCPLVSDISFHFFHVSYPHCPPPLFTYPPALRISYLALSLPAISMRYTDGVRMATREILTACREFWLFSSRSTMSARCCGTIICVSSGRLLPDQLLFFFFMFHTISINLSFHVQVFHLTPNGNEPLFQCVYFYLPHTGDNTSSGYDIPTVTRCLSPHGSSNYEWDKSHIWVVVKKKLQPELTVMNIESKKKLCRIDHEASVLSCKVLKEQKRQV